MMSPATAFYEEIRVIVHEGVYEPAEDTFLLCKNLDIKPGDRVLEVGTGCGLVAIVAAKSGATVVATDQSLQAVNNARENVERHNLHNRIEIRHGQLFEPIGRNEKFSLIAFNPPYLPGTQQDPGYDPAWTGGENGRITIDKFLKECVHYLELNGRVLLVQSSLSNSDKTRQILKEKFHKVHLKAESPSFFEQILLFGARNPR